MNKKKMHATIQTMLIKLGALMQDLRPDIAQSLTDRNLINACVLTMLYCIEDKVDLSMAIEKAWGIATYNPEVADAMRSIANTRLAIHVKSDVADEYIAGVCITAFYCILMDSQSPLMAYTFGLQLMSELDDE